MSSRATSARQSIFDVIDGELARDFFGTLAMRAGNRDDARVLAVSEPGNLRRAREAGADDANANYLFFGQVDRKLILPTDFCLLISASCPLSYGAPAGIRTPNQQIMSLLL